MKNFIFALIGCTLVVIFHFSASTGIFVLFVSMFLLLLDLHRKINPDTEHLQRQINHLKNLLAEKDFYVSELKDEIASVNNENYDLKSALNSSDLTMKQTIAKLKAISKNIKITEKTDGTEWDEK